MAGDGFYWQNKMFYCEHWTPEIEDTFIQSLLAHHRKGTFHHERTNCHAVLCALFDINARYGATLSYSYCQRRLAKLKIRHHVFSWVTSLVAVEWDPKKNIISADTYVWEQIAKAKSIAKCYVKAPEPQWSVLWILFGEWIGDDSDEDESVYFDRAGTCLDDEWVTNKAPPADDSYGDSSFGNDHDVEREEPSWWAFVQEYYASDSGTGSVNTHTRTIRRPATSGFATPLPQSPIKDVNTPSSVASNDPDIEDNSPSLYIPKYLRRRQPKKPKF
ncbi:hypothetical protein Salat_1679400 [Sesamum alatum]|uniref:Myb/SANT-like domain-containing protein n=1 Tax=Sesamum alatum TaxID=300844 RepID=A0AAE1Y863_9LAMI|nr:hypothetical protein Salat_1679400 [Sesamum alatum]